MSKFSKEEWIISKSGLGFYIINRNEDYLHKDLTVQPSCGEVNFHETQESAKALIEMKRQSCLVDGGCDE